MKGLLNKRNGIIASIILAVLIVAVILSTSISSAMNLDEAKDIAQKYVPSTAKFISSEEEDRRFEVVFYDEEKKEQFEVEVNKETGEVKKVESQLSNDLGSKKIVLTENEAKKVVENRFEGITSAQVVLTKDNGLFEYEVDFKGDGFYGEADVNAETGVVLESVVKYGSVTTIPADVDNDKSQLLSYEQAKDAVVKEAGGGTVRDIDLDEENDSYFYEVELHKDGMERDYIVNAETGEVVLESEHQCPFDHSDDDVNKEQAASSDVTAEPKEESKAEEGLISEDEAKKIVRTKIPGAEFVEFYLEYDDGIPQYEGTAHLDGFEYEFEINAKSGVIIGWDKDEIDYDDDDDDEWDD